MRPAMGDLISVYCRLIRAFSTVALSASTVAASAAALALLSSAVLARDDHEDRHRHDRPRVVNVDGKVNRDALAYQDRMWVYLDQRAIRWFVDSPWYVERMLGPDPAKNGWSLVAMAGGTAEFRLYRRD